MSFRDNLQHLRAERGMTQEHLAMLLGVSRQSVTKWEAERAYPEMDKLLKMCQVFGCTLDELVQGDLAGCASADIGKGVSCAAASAPGAADPVLDAASASGISGASGTCALGGDARAAALAPAAARIPHVPQDICGYDEHMRTFAARIPAGIAAVILGVAVGVWACAALAPASLADAACLGAILLGVLVGLALIVPAGLDHGAFAKAHPFVEDFYTAEQKARARRQFACGLVAGIGAIFVGLLVVALFPDGDDPLGVALFLALTAAGVWSIVHFAMLLGRTDVAAYNNEAVEALTDDEIDALPDAQRREAARRAKRQGSAVGAACGIIMMLATVAGLVLLFVPAVQTPYFWLAWVVGGLLCGVASVAIRGFGGQK